MLLLCCCCLCCRTVSAPPARGYRLTDSGRGPPEQFRPEPRTPRSSSSASPALPAPAPGSEHERCVRGVIDQGEGDLPAAAAASTTAAPSPHDSPPAP